MKNTTLVGAFLLIIGIVLLVFQGFSFTRKEKVVDIGSVQISKDKRESVWLPPIVGWIVTGTGVALLVSGLRSSKA